jgi:hypothetical protein
MNPNPKTHMKPKLVTIAAVAAQGDALVKNVGAIAQANAARASCRKLRSRWKP